MAENGDAPEPKQEPVIIGLIVKDQAGTEVMFKVKPHTKLSKVMAAYCQKKGLDQGSIRFLYEGQRVNDDDTPQGLDMEDGDHIDAVAAQVGGC